MATETGEGTADASEGTSDAQESVDSVSDEETESESRYSPHARSIIVTVGSTLAGMVTALVSTLYVSDPESLTPLLLVAAAVFVQFPIYRVIGLDVDDFGMKGKLYIGVMTFILWFLTWGLILTTGAVDAIQ